MSGAELAPQVSVLALSIGLLFALVCYLLTNLSPGGMITPGWIALALIVRPSLALIIAAVAAVTWVACVGLQRVVILYGKRLFATVVLVGVFLQVSLFVFNLTRAQDAIDDYTTLGFIVPGLVAYQLIRQPIVATIVSTATVASLAYVVVLIGVKLRFIESAGAGVAAGRLQAPSVSAGPVQVVVVVAVLIVGFVALALALRRVESKRPPIQRTSPRGSDRAEG